LIVEGGRFSVKSNGNDLIVSFTNGSEGAICDVNNRVLVVGDLKFYAQILGRENTSSFWCMWCNAHPNTWKDMNYNSDLIPWTIERIKEHKSRIVREDLKDAKDICGIVDFPLWDFIQPSHKIFPQLHIEIGLINNILESFNDFESRLRLHPRKSDWHVTI
jgi:hypothetical protein